MQPLTLDDLLPLEEYAGRRREFFESLSRYLDRYRRIRVGPLLTLLFENRQTLWFRVQEILRVARLSDPVRVQQELELYNRLLPGRNQLCASLLIETADESRLIQELARWQGFHGEQLTLCLGHVRRPTSLVTCRPEDLATGAAHWISLELGQEERRFLGDLSLPAHFEVSQGNYHHLSEPLGEDIRQSLLDDLTLSDRDKAAA
jgi:hypothetical protein